MDRSQTRSRIVLVGLGAAAHNIHLPALRQCAGVEVVGGVDPDPAARERFSTVAPGVASSPDLSALVRAERPDWVLVGAPPSAHADLCIAALELGAHVFCEKPFVESVEEADAVLSAAARLNLQVAVNHEFGRMPIFEAAQDAIDGDAFGRLLFVQAWEHVLDTEVDGWRASRRTMREFGTHVVDLVARFYGQLPSAVFARMPSLPEIGPGDPIDVVTLEFPDGRVASIVLDRVCRGAHRYLDVRLDGERASLRASIGGRARVSAYLSAQRRRPGGRLELAAGGIAWLEVGDRRRTLARNPSNAFAQATARLLDAVVSAVARGQEPPCTGAYARDVVAVVEAAYESARTGQVVRIVPRPDPSAAHAASRLGIEPGSG